MRYKITITLMLMASLTTKAEIKYDVSFPNASGHYAQISITTQVNKGDTLRFKMPVWTPGSYKVREFSQNVDESWYANNGSRLHPTRADKNTWICAAVSDGNLTFTYNVYAFDLGVRTSYVDDNMAFLHGGSAFMYIEGSEHLPLVVAFEPRNNWSNVEMPLSRITNSTSYSCPSFDLLADSPVALGNFEISTYETTSVPHKIVMIGDGNYDLEKVTEDFKKITDQEADMFGGKHPSNVYIHFIQNVNAGGGGLEHLNSQTSQVNRWVYQDEKLYLKFLGLISHEYFHLWNIKRIRPIELGPFDYNRENYTDMLWVAEGITSYYDDLILRRAGFHNDETYFTAIATNITRLQNQPGRTVMSLDESSQLAWIKAYMSNENSNNKTISYYNKGMLVAWMLDVEILNNTGGKGRLDDVMVFLFNEYYTKLGRGFTHQEFIQACEKIAGSSLTSFFEEYIFGKTPLPYNKYAELLGLTINNDLPESASLGLKTKSENGKLMITYIEPEGSASIAGLSVHDEIISINNWRIGEDINNKIPGFDIGKTVVIIYVRDGQMFETNATLLSSSEVKFTVVVSDELTKQQEELFQIWLD
ncbi:MAG: putative metalloprotease with PDZ domain [Bacteroidia bacterium]|jgi:predicted metalloprotease with PDZ domain